MWKWKVEGDYDVGGRSGTAALGMGEDRFPDYIKSHNMLDHHKFTVETNCHQPSSERMLVGRTLLGPHATGQYNIVSNPEETKPGTILRNAWSYLWDLW